MGMPSVAFDTHEAVKRLLHAGADERLAEAVVATVGGAISDQVATKSDLAELRTHIEKFELRMTNNLYAASAASVALIKALDFFIG